VLDEPTTAGRASVRSLRLLLRRMRDAGACIVFSSHVLDQVRELCDRIVIVAHAAWWRGRHGELCGGLAWPLWKMLSWPSRAPGSAVMLNQVLIVAGKEATDNWRDRRSLLSAALYCLMGPAWSGWFRSPFATAVRC